MSRRRQAPSAALSLDSFLDIVTNAVGMLILIAVVTVLGARDVAVSAGPSVLRQPSASATRVLFECSADQVFFIDEQAHGKRVEEVVRSTPSGPASTEMVEQLLLDRDVGDETYRVQARALTEGLAWLYERRPDARGVKADDLARQDGAFLQALEGLDDGAFVYFVVREDGFEAFRRAREVVAARGLAMGWHPVEGGGAIRLSSVGSLGKRIQ
jgi:hypothetical protein